MFDETQASDSQPDRVLEVTRLQCSPDDYCYWQSSDSDTSDFCRLATSLLKYTCSIIVGICTYHLYCPLLEALLLYYNMLVGVAHRLLSKFKT